MQRWAGFLLKHYLNFHGSFVQFAKKRLLASLNGQMIRFLGY